MIPRLISGLFIAASIGIALAPATAAHTPDCVQNGSTALCQQPGHSSIPTSPGDPMPNGNVFGWYAGTLPMPPVFAVDSG